MNDKTIIRSPMTRERLCRRLADGSAGGSIGNEGQNPSAAPSLRRGDHDLNPGTEPSAPLTPAAVLVPVIDHAKGMTVLFTRRTEHLLHHGGQISFPGGHIEKDDGGAEQTALRETEEEVGLDRRRVEIIGRLDNYTTGTGFRITPVVGVIEPPLDLDPDPYEVAEVFEVPMDFFLEPANHQRHNRVFKGRRREYYAIPYGGYYIWGATAGMLVNLYERISSP